MLILWLIFILFIYLFIYLFHATSLFGFSPTNREETITEILCLKLLNMKIYLKKSFISRNDNPETTKICIYCLLSFRTLYLYNTVYELLKVNPLVKVEFVYRSDSIQL